MSQGTAHRVAGELLARLGAGSDPEVIAALFSPDLEWNIPGDPTVLPWLGRKAGRNAVADFIRDTRKLLDPIRFEVHDIVAGDARAVILGELASTVKATGKMVETAFAIVLTVSGDEITRFLMLEDSLAVSAAARR